MKKDNILIKVLGLIIILLLGSCAYLWSQTKKPNLDVSIGSPIDEYMVEFGYPIEEEKVVNNILFALINATSIDKPKIVGNLPNATIKIDDLKGGFGYYNIDVWIDGDDIIFSLDDNIEGGKVEYKRTSGEDGKTLIEYISKYK